MARDESRRIEPADEFEALEETAVILSDRELLSAIEEGLAEIDRGDAITLAELRDELHANREVTRHS